SDDTVVQPDISVVCGGEKRGREGCHGAPDLVVEILSPSNTAIEMERKFSLYHDAGVREYWIVNPENKRIKVHLFHEGVISTIIYGSTGTVAVSIFPDLNITLEQVFAE
ncbi:MAG: Uma2 family endonuclease, partial [Treponema sp.]|nr:Uma2 family endonuclease [Treponema sp.]